MGERKVIFTTCKSCHGGCGVKVTVEDGVIVHIEGNPDSLTRGTMCSKGLSSIQHVDNPYRLKYPLKRAGEKGEGKWKRISWDEALDTISGKMKEAIEKYGPFSIAISQGTGRGYNRYTHRFARSIGTGNIISPGYVCHSPRLGLYGLVTGYGRLYCDYHGWGGEFPKTQIMWAKQLEISSADSEMAYWFMNSLNYAKNLIIIDPRATAYATRATLWLQPRPGTDCALAMGMMNFIINEGLYDKEFVENWTYGFEELKERVQLYPGKSGRNYLGTGRENYPGSPAFCHRYPGLYSGRQFTGKTGQLRSYLKSHHLPDGALRQYRKTGQHDQLGLAGYRTDRGFLFADSHSDEMKKKIIGGDKFKLGAARTCNPDTLVKKINLR